jgi:hypothetical protein
MTNVEEDDLLPIKYFKQMSFKRGIVMFLNMTRDHITRSFINQQNATGKSLKQNTKDWVERKRRIIPKHAQIRGRFSGALLKAISDKNTIRASSHKGDYGPVTGHINTLDGNRQLDATVYFPIYNTLKAGGKNEDGGIIGFPPSFIKKLENDIANMVVNEFMRT